MSLGVYLNGRSIKLRDADLLGSGGEARVFRAGQLAVKVFHDAPDARRIEKVKRLAAMAHDLPRELVLPCALVTDASGAVVGYSMPLVPEAAPVARLAQRPYRERVVSNAEVIALFLAVHRVVSTVHAAGVVVGDFNDENVLFRGEQPAFIDADSMQLDGLPCPVAHERFLDPRLYGVDLTVGAAFDAGSDWYAFAVMLFASLLYVHPYGGVHARIGTMLRRAEARHSVLRTDVVWPRVAAPRDALPDDLLHWFGTVFDQGRREAMPLALLAPAAWRRCTSCGVEHARALCPACHVAGAATRTLARVHGRCNATSLFRTRGRLVAVSLDGARARWAYEDDGVVRREDGSRVTEQRLLPGMRFVISGASTWVGAGRRLVRVAGESVVERTTTGELAGSPVFAVTNGALFRTDADTLVDASRGARVGRVLDGQTWIWGGAGLGFGLWRAGLVSFFFLFREGRAGLARVELPPLSGRLVDAHVTFDADFALVCLGTEKDGVRTNAIYLVSSSGAVVARVSGCPDDARVLASIQGKALARGRVLAATDDGLVLLEAAHGQLVERAHFPDTAPFVGAGVDLLPGPDGSVYVVTTQEIVQLRLEKTP